ncbi:unnamed protein product, partial [Prorocentrum cordatum]
ASGAPCLELPTPKAGARVHFGGLELLSPMHCSQDGSPMAASTAPASPWSPVTPMVASSGSSAFFPSSAGAGRLCSGAAQGASATFQGLDVAPSPTMSPGAVIRRNADRLGIPLNLQVQGILAPIPVGGSTGRCGDEEPHVIRLEAELAGAPAAKHPARASRATSDRDDNSFRLLICTAKLGIKSATDLRMVSAIVYRAAKVKSDTPIKTKGVTGHKEGPPDVVAMVTFLLDLEQTLEPTDPKATLLNEFSTNHPPTSDILAKRMLCFKVQDAWDRNMCKLYIRLHKDIENIGKISMDHLIATGGTEVYGSAPRGSLERQIADLMMGLGMPARSSCDSGPECLSKGCG